MVLNAVKTKVMLFGDSNNGDIALQMNGSKIEHVSEFKYLGVWLDSQLNFSLKFDYAVAKAKRSSAKICSLFNGREGISVQLAVELYKSLVRPYPEYAVTVWAGMSSKDMDKVEQVQVQCLRRMIGAKAHSSSIAVEVITGTLPMRLRIRDLCCREYFRIIGKDDGHCLRQLMSTSARKALCFCPLMYFVCHE